MRGKLLLLYFTLLSGFSFAQTIQLTNSGSTSISGATEPVPISAYFESMRFQVVYTAAELTAAGITGPKAVTQLGWYVTTAPANALPNYSIRMANTTATNSSSNNTATLTDVYSNASYAPVAGGFDMLNLNGAFIWDGTSNILIDVCYSGAVYASPYGQLRTYAATTTSGSRRIRCDNCGSQCGVATNTTNTFKPQVSLTFGAPPSCLPPGGLTALPGSVTANVSWNPVSGATGYQWAVTTSATPPASGATTTNTSLTASSLAVATAYYLHVRTDCGGSFSTWSTIPFTTVSCAATNIPYTQNFDGVTAPAIPTCINVQNVNGNSAWGTYSTPTVIIIGAPNSMVYPYNSTSAANDWFYLQGLNLTAGTSYRLSFKWMSNPSYPESFEIKYGTSPTSAAMTTGTLYTNASAASATPVTEGIDFTPTTSGEYYIGFHCYSAADQDFLAIDDISVDLSPSCPNPSGLAIVSTSSTTANLNWNASGSATGYEWQVSTSNTPPASGTAVGTNTAPVTALAAGTQYYAHVRSVCAGPSYSSWSTMAFGWLPNDSACGAVPLILDGANSCTNTTAATSIGDPAMPGACSTPNNTVWYSYTPTTSGKVIFRTEIPSTSTNGLEGWVAWYTGTSCPNTTLTAVPGSVCQSFGPDAGMIDSLLSPVLTAGTTYYIMIDGVTGAFGEACFSIVSPPPPPDCVTNIAPANAATNVATTPAPTFSWNADRSATSYSVYFGTTNPPTTNIGSTAGTSTTITGMAYNTTYYWYVVPANAAGDAVGCSTNITSFTTAPPPANCVPASTNGCTDDDAITLFRLKGEGSELNINTGLTCNANAYVDTTDHATVIDLARGKTYWGQAQSGTTGDYLTLWLDANDNGIYENSERLLNNLPISSAAATNFNLFIPIGTATGNHTLRARLVYYGTITPPTVVTDPCSNYAYSETEDYKVNITASGASYTVSSYASTGSCYTGGGAITIDAASNNNSNFVPLVDSNNALIAQLYPQGNNLGRVSTSYYKHNGAVRQDAGGRYYLDRNLTITVGTQPTAPYNLRYYFQNSELNTLIAQPGSGVTSVFDLNMTKNGDACLSAIGTGGTGGIAIAPTGFGSIGGDRFLDFTGLTGFSSFYLHGGATPIPVSLVNFTAQRIGKQNKVTWSTSQEINTSYFVIERSNDGSNFTEIGRVNANGNSNTTLNYSFVDNNPVKGINYYRLRIVDRDNSAKNSAIRSVRNEGIADIAVYPNPVNNVMTVNIDADKAEKGSLAITDVTGKVILIRTITVAQGNNKLPINTSSLASGAYIIKVQLNDDVVVRKFNKQ